MPEHTDTTIAARPKPVPLTPTALGYLAELDSAAELVLHRREQAELDDRGRWLMMPAGLHRHIPRGAGAASNDPLMHVENYRANRVMAEVRLARCDVGRVAWWFTTAALAALDATLVGKEITARQLEQATLLRPGRDEEIAGEVSPWAPCFRPHLPGPGELRTGNARLDESMDAELVPLREAYAAAAEAELRWAEQDEQDDRDDRDDDEGPHGMPEHEAAALHEAEGKAYRIPDLLINYARAVRTAATAAHRG